ncbi:MAG: TonB-dependent receptor plug domain-containing protein [Parvibaculales bacterium]
MNFSGQKNRSRNTALALAVMVPLAPYPGLAGPVSEITVYGTRLPTALSEAGTSVSVITAEQIRLRGYDFVIDAVADAPGVSVNQNGPFGGSGFVRTRGASANGHTLVLIDGVAVNDPTSVGNAFNFASLDAANIERIEILKGGQATLWGSDAMAGVVSIMTKQPEGSEFSGYGEAGSFNTIRAGMAVGGVRGSASGRLAVNYQESDGISKAEEDDGNPEKDGFEGVSLSAKGRVTVSDRLRLDAALYATSSKTEFDAFGPVDGEALADNDQLVATLGAHYAPSEDVTHDLQFGFTRVERDNYGADAYPFGERGRRLQLRYQSVIQLDDTSRTAFGIDFEDIQAENAGMDDEADMTSLFGLYERSPSDRLTLTAGLRHDDHSLFGDDVTGRATAAYELSEKVRLRAAYSQGRKAPTLDELNDTASLQPEETTSFDLGLTYQGGAGLLLDLTYFRQDTKNLLQYVGVWPCAANCYANVNEADTQGFEVSAQMGLTDTVTLTADYTFTDATTGGGQRLGRIPEHEGNIALAYDGGDVFSANLIVRYNGTEANSNGSTVMLGSWTRVDANAAYELGSGWQLYGRVENLFDEDYQQVLGYGTPGLSGSVGVRFGL